MNRRIKVLGTALPEATQILQQSSIYPPRICCYYHVPYFMQYFEVFTDFINVRALTSVKYLE